MVPMGEWNIDGGITEMILVGMDRVQNLSMQAMLHVPYFTLQLLEAP